MRKGCLEYGVDGFADADVTKKGKVGGTIVGERRCRRGGRRRRRGSGSGWVWVKGGHASDGVFESAADCCYEVIVGEGGLDYAAAYVTRCSKYL